MRLRLPLLLACLAFIGCGPNLHTLVEAKHYREAICAAHDGNAGDRSFVGEALDTDAGLLLHMHVVSSDELRPTLEAATDSVLTRGRLVRVIVQSNSLPIDGLNLSGSFVTDAGHVAGLVADWTALAWLTEEKLPPRRMTQTYLTGENFLKTGAAILTAGLSLLFTDFRPGNVEVDAPLEEYARMAPRAYALHRTTGSGGCTNVALTGNVGRRCTWYYVLDNISRAPVSFDLQARYASTRKTDKSPSDEEQQCLVQRRVRVPLGLPSEIETIVQRRFGQQMQPVRTVARKNGSGQTSTSSPLPR